MKGSLLVLSMFFVGCVLGYVWNFSGWELGDTHHLSMYILYALMFQVGVSIGGGEDFKELLRGFRPKMLLIPLATIGGTLLFSALVSVLLTRWSVFDCLAVGSHRRNPAVFGIGQCAADPLECVRLSGRGQRTGVLFAFVHPDYGTQNPRPWCTAGYGTGHDCTSDECHPRAGGTGGSSFHLQILREAGSYFGGRSNLGRCSSSLHYPCVWKGNGAPCHLPRAAGRHVRAVFHFFVLQAVKEIPVCKAKR